MKTALIIFYMLNGNVASVTWDVYKNPVQCNKNLSDAASEFLEYYPTGYPFVGAQCVPFGR